MIVNYEYLNGKLIISYIDQKGNLKFKNYQWQRPMEWVMCSDRDPNKSKTYFSWDGKPVKLDNVRYPNRYTIYDFMHNLSEEEQKDIFSYNEPKLFFCDIEVEITDGFPEAHIANNQVTAISMIHNNKVVMLGLKPLSDNQIAKMEEEMNEYFKAFDTKYKIDFVFCESEHKLLDMFFNDFVPKMPVLTGWNFISYDWVYLVTRARKLNINPNVASPTGQLVKPWKKNSANMKPSFEELPKHRLVFDYMDIFDKWDTSIKIKESNTLDFISSKVLNVKKLEYPGTLKDLYHNDWYKYCLYCNVDTALVQQIHKKQRTFDLMLAISNLANIQIVDSTSAIRVTEGLFYKDYKAQGIVMVKQKDNAVTNIPGIEQPEEESDLSGGYVKYPKVGMRNWVTVFDFASLYPTTMRQFNIAPESFKGVKINDKEALLNGVKRDLEENDIILLNNTVFRNEDSKTKEILTRIFSDRKKNKAISFDHKKQMQLVKDYYNKRFKTSI